MLRRRPSDGKCPSARGALARRFRELLSEAAYPLMEGAARPLS